MIIVIDQAEPGIPPWKVLIRNSKSRTKVKRSKKSVLILCDRKDDEFSGNYLLDA
jgi:hypothetical protein